MNNSHLSLTAKNQAEKTSIKPHSCLPSGPDYFLAPASQPNSAPPGRDSISASLPAKLPLRASSKKFALPGFKNYTSLKSQNPLITTTLLLAANYAYVKQNLAKFRIFFARNP
jgi:hypothetical protein